MKWNPDAFVWFERGDVANDYDWLLGVIVQESDAAYLIASICHHMLIDGFSLFRKDAVEQVLPDVRGQILAQALEHHGEVLPDPPLDESPPIESLLHALKDSGEICAVYYYDEDYNDEAAWMGYVVEVGAGRMTFQGVDFDGTLNPAYDVMEIDDCTRIEFRDRAMAAYDRYLKGPKNLSGLE